MRAEAVALATSIMKKPLFNQNVSLFSNYGKDDRRWNKWGDKGGLVRSKDEISMRVGCTVIFRVETNKAHKANDASS